ncbi:MAG TPA: PDZ domain-containing protein [Candidatus Acidoferrales bacterium]|nr:PDZ domain-containing protein [Candidatus Acidoferrales bacterium]
MRRVRRAVFALVVAVSCVAVLGGTENQMREGRLMRFPDVRNGKIVFSYAGDLWLVPTGGGIARRITTDPGLELFPKFSPDGSQIAFTGEYDGKPNVYVIPAEGGEPKQLTFESAMSEIPERMGVENEVITWMPDGKSIAFLSRRDTFNDWFGRLFEVPVTGGLPTRLPFDNRGGLTSFSPDGTTIAYNRIFRNFRTWKRYTGGMAQKISLYNLKTNHYEEIDSSYKGTDTFPMWHGDTIYFDSDQGAEHRMNLCAYSLKTKQIRQLTHFKDFDVNWPSLGPDSIVFENGGYLYLFDLATEKAKKVTVYLPGDFDQARPHWEKTANLIQSFDISPEGKRATFEARGDVYTVPAEKGSIRNLTHTPGIREQDVAWSPNGKWIAYLSDRTGEQELYLMPQNGMGKEERITSGGTMFRLQPAWSPDSTKLLFADKTARLFYVDIHDKTPVLVDQGHYADLTDYNWSPDSKWVVYAKAAMNGEQVLYLYSLADKKITPVTTDFNNSHNPVFDPGGKYLYFLSERDYNEVLGVYDIEFSNPKAGRVYAITLRADTPSPFAPESDEAVVKPAPDEKIVPASGPEQSKEPKNEQKKPGTPTANQSAKKAESAEKKEAFRIDLDGIQNRVVALPTPPESMGGLGASKGYVFYVTTPIFGLSGPLSGGTFAIHIFDMDKRKDSVLISGARGYALSFDGKKLLYSGPPSGPSSDDRPVQTYGIIDATPAPSPHHVGEGALALDDMQAEVDPHAEWKQMLDEVYRQERDYFYEASMNGVDWKAQRDKYAQLLPYVADRYDLNYILGEFIGELSNSHTYVGGGDYPTLHPVNVGLLGVDFETDSASGRYRFKKIYPGENWDAALRSPLTEPGVEVKQGDYLLAVNGEELRAPQNPYALFQNTPGQNVTLTVNSKPSDEGSHQVVVKPISGEFGLRELDWIDTNREKVDRLSGGKVGYVYLPDMEGPGLNEFVKQYFPQIRKQGIIFDVRYNGGGFVDEIILEHLRRILAAMQTARNSESGTVPTNVFYGYMACITNHYAASDGDFFTYFFKHYKLGPVIGTRTWGGVRGIRGEIPLMDGGYITRPEFALYGLNSQWIVENHGVQPDIVVENTPDKTINGHDPQLERTVDILMKEIQEHPKTLPHRPPDLPPYPPGPGN